VTWDVRQPEPCTSWARRKCHYSADLRRAQYGAGRVGIARCGAEVVDQERVDYWEAGRRRCTDISTLPECKLCVRRRSR
jgi:hypothetical protein